MIPFIDLKAQYNYIKKDIDLAIQQVIENTSFIGGGVVKKFEESFASHVGMRHCVACANGTDSLEIILKALNIGPDDQIIVPACTWFATAEIVSNVGAEPVFVDVLEQEYTLDPKQLEDKVNKKTRLIIPVHLYGLPARLPEIMSIAERHNLLVVEDCAQAHGAKIHGQQVSTFGKASSFSFYPSKNLGAYGDAGGMVTNDNDLVDILRMIGNHGQLEKHDHQMIGRNSRMDTLQAAILNTKLPYLNRWIKKRQQVASWYNDWLEDHITKPTTPEGFEHVYHLYVIRTNKRRQLIEKLREAQIGFSIHYPTPLPFTKAYAYKNHTPEQFPVATSHRDKILSLPIFPEMTYKMVKKVVEIVNRFG